MIISNKSVIWHEPVNAAKYLSDSELRQEELSISKRGGGKFLRRLGN